MSQSVTLESQKQAGLQRLAETRDRMRDELVAVMRSHLKGEADGAANMLRCVGVLTVREMDDELIANEEAFKEKQPPRALKQVGQS